jgi:NodT family efflux transporter outer membrane factor (OMF) lipoprotein
VWHKVIGDIKVYRKAFNLRPLHNRYERLKDKAHGTQQRDSTGQYSERVVGVSDSMAACRHSRLDLQVESWGEARVPRNAAFWSRRRLCNGFYLVLALAGCAVGPDYQRPQTKVPSHFGLMASWLDTSTPHTTWWQTFNDTKLNQLVDQALKQNLEITAALAKVQQAHAIRAMIAGGQWPKASFSARIMHDRFSTLSEQFANIPFPNPRNKFTDYRADLAASWELDLFGYTARSIEAATARAESTTEMAHAIVLATVADVVRHYLDLCTLQQRALIAQRIIQLATEQLRLVRLQHQAGMIAQDSVNQAEENLRLIEAQLPTIQAGIRADLDALTVLTGTMPHTLDELLRETRLLKAEGVVGIGLPSELLLRRPDVRRAERELAAANADVGVAIAAQYPRFTLIGAIGVDSIYQGQLTNQAARFWSIGPSLSLPILAGGALASQVQANQAAYAATLANYRKIVLQALADTETALMRYDKERTRLSKLSAIRDLADHSLKLTQQRAAVGEAANLESVQADIHLQQTTDTWLNAHLAHSLALVNLYQVLGGGW